MDFCNILARSVVRRVEAESIGHHAVVVDIDCLNMICLLFLNQFESHDTLVMIIDIRKLMLFKVQKVTLVLMMECLKKFGLKRVRKNHNGVFCQTGSVQ